VLAARSAFTCSPPPTFAQEHEYVGDRTFAGSVAQNRLLPSRSFFGWLSIASGGGQSPVVPRLAVRAVLLLPFLLGRQIEALA
jgi:hypothetical protein